MRNSSLFCLGVVILGIFLQLIFGYFNFYLLKYPANIYAASFIILISVLSLFFVNSKFVKWLSSTSLSVALIITFLIISLILGFTPLEAVPLTSSWPFVLIYLFTILSLGIVIARKFFFFKIKHFSFYLNHLGVWVVLVAAGFGYADIERYIMHVQEGEFEWRVYDNEKNVKELPIAIELKDFDMEVYPPKLAVIDIENGDILPVSKPHFFQIDPLNISHTKRVHEWEVSVEEYIHNAVRNSDSTYREIPMPGSTPAALVRAVNINNQESFRGWVSGGNQNQLFMTLSLSNNQAVVMTVPEPKRFYSDVIVYTQDGERKKSVLEVNKPIKIGNWTIYQYGYDSAAGRLSSYSSMELVYDPWLWAVYLGFILIALGSLSLIWK